MIIDSHNHPDWHGHNLEKYLQNMDALDIDRTWLLTWECPQDEFDPVSYNHCLGLRNSDGPIPFSRALNYVERAPDRFILGYAPDPRKPEAIDRLRAAVSIYDVKVYGELKLRMMYDNPDALAMYRACGELSLPVTVHIDYEIPSKNSWPWTSYWYGGGIEAFERAVAACPETVFLGHAPGFWAHISGDGRYAEEAYPDGAVAPGGKLISMLRTYPNLYCDISAGSGYNALARDQEHALRFIDEFQKKILYARDYFDTRHQELLRSLNLDKNVLEKIFFRNSLTLLGEA